MSQVQPPRTRTSKHRPETIHLVRSALLNLGTLIVTSMLVRVAIMLAVPNTTQRGLDLVAKATHLIVWPLELISPLARQIHGGLTIADLVALALLVTFWAVALGIVAGWEQEDHRFQAGLPQSRQRP